MQLLLLCEDINSIVNLVPIAKQNFDVTFSSKVIAEKHDDFVDPTRRRFVNILPSYKTAGSDESGWSRKWCPEQSPTYHESWIQQNMDLHPESRTLILPSTQKQYSKQYKHRLLISLASRTRGPYQHKGNRCGYQDGLAVTPTAFARRWLQSSQSISINEAPTRHEQRQTDCKWKRIVLDWCDPSVSPATMTNIWSTETHDGAEDASSSSTFKELAEILHTHIFIYHWPRYNYVCKKSIL